MKHLSFLLCCTLFVVSLVAQNTATWFPPGAKWQYDYESLGGPGLEILEHVGPEVVGGQLCAKLHWYGYRYGWMPGPVNHGYQYMYAQHDSVFRWTGSAFELLYDFTRQAGDAIMPSSGLYDAGTVDATGVDTLWEVPVRFQDISLFGANLPDTLRTRVHEHFGGQHLIYWDIESPITEIQYGLTCYRDDQYPHPDCYFGYDPRYRPFPVGTATWSEEDGSFCGFRGYQYKMEGDTVISGVGQSKKLYSRNTYVGSYGCPVLGNNMNLDEPFQLLGILSQNVPQKKVYFTRLIENPLFPLCLIGAGEEQFPLHQPVLLYDFDLAVGDTIAWRDSYNTVLSIDSIRLKDGTWRRTFQFDEQGYYFWIEGIGSNLGLLASYADLMLTDVGCTLRCFRENGQLKYPRELANDVFCDSILTAITDPKDLSGQMQLYPNPTTGTITLEIPGDAVPALARLFDAQGREVSRREVTGMLTHWTLPTTGRQVLFLHLQTHDQRSGNQVLRVE